MLQTACRRGFAVASVKCFPIPQWRRGCSSRNHDRDRAGAYENSDPELDIPASEIVLASKPAPGSPVTLDNFAHQSYNLQNDAVQGRVPPGHVLVKTMWLSVDPFMRCRFNDDTGVDYTAPYTVGEPIKSAGIGYVQVSGDDVDDLKPGSFVIDPFDGWPWRSDAVLDATQLTPITQAIETLMPVTQLLSNVGLSGLTALHGIRDAGQVSASDTVIVSGAAGSVGLLASQFALRAGATVIGICGTPEKAKALTNEVGCHAAVTYKDKSEAELASALAVAILETSGKSQATLYFDNVGGVVSEAVVNRLAPHGKIVICGQISMYDSDEDYPPPMSPTAQSLLAQRNISRERFLVLDHASEFSSSLAELCQLTATGALQQHETITAGLAQAPDAFVGMMSGQNFGKALVKCADPPPSAQMYAFLRSVLPTAIRRRLSTITISEASFAPNSRT